jgi:hypothetical protein
VSAIHVVAVSHGFHRTCLGMITRIVFHVHPRHAAIVVHPRNATVLMGSGVLLRIRLRIGVLCVLRGRLCVQLAGGRANQQYGRGQND